MLLGLWTNYYQDWSLQHTVTFDGVSKIITLGPNSNTLDIKELYASWKEWTQLRDNSKFLPAIRTTGGDPIGVGAYTGDVYFLINNWRILIDHSCNIDGVIYSDDYPSPFVQVSGTQIVTNKVSSLVSVVAPIVSVDGLVVPTAAEISKATWEANIRSLTIAPPTAAEVRQEIDANSIRLASIQSSIDTVPTAVTAAMDNNSVKLAQIKAILDSMDTPTAQETAAAVWNTPVNTTTDKSTIGGYISRVLLSIPKFIGLK